MDPKNNYPVNYEGKDYYEEDCDILFSVAYHGPESQRPDGSVYVSDGLWVYPDGTSYDEKN
jgi:hypothetical protein